MASGPLPKRVVCPACGAPEGIPCRDPETKGPVRKPHLARTAAAALWYDRQSPDGLTLRGAGGYPLRSPGDQGTAPKAASSPDGRGCSVVRPAVAGRTYSAAQG